MEESPTYINQVKKEVTDVKSEAIDSIEYDAEDQIHTLQIEGDDSEVHTVVLQNIEIQDTSEIPIVINDFSNSIDSDGNLQIDTSDDNVIHTYIIE